MDNIIEFLYQNRDESFANFHRGLIPTVEEDKVIGVRTPVLRKYAKVIKYESYCEEFLNELPHKFYEENQLHGFILSEIKDFDECIRRVEQFLPYIDNWATCDQTSPLVFKKNKEKLLTYVEKWIESDATYIKRFGIGKLMLYYLDDNFEPRFLDIVTSIRTDEYYINMQIAWFMATALAKQWESTIPYIEKVTMDNWVHNKTIQKAKESYRITNEQKIYLNSLKLKRI